MNKNPYVNNMFDREDPYSTKATVVGRVNCILQVRSDKRDLNLCPFPSRAVVRNEIHELILTSETEAVPGKTVNQVAYLGFFEVIEGGIIWVGDCVDIEGTTIGHVAGYDLTHFPNHMNIVIRTRTVGPMQTGHESGIQLGATIHFTQPS